MKITVEFDNGTTLAIAPEQLSLQETTAGLTTLSGVAGTFNIPIAHFPVQLATKEEVAARTAAEPVQEATEVLPPKTFDLCLEPTAGFSCSLQAGHGGEFHAAYEDHNIKGTLIGRKYITPSPHIPAPDARISKGNVLL